MHRRNKGIKTLLLLACSFPSSSIGSSLRCAVDSCMYVGEADGSDVEACPKLFFILVQPVND